MSQMMDMMSYSVLLRIASRLLFVFIFGRLVVWLFGGLGKFVVVAGNIPKRLNDLTTKPLVSAAKVWGNGVRNTEKSPKDDVFGRILTFINRNKCVRAQ